MAQFHKGLLSSSTLLIQLFNDRLAYCNGVTMGRTGGTSPISPSAPQVDHKVGMESLAL